ncbi:DUF389 domain-containing protein [Polymorphobacter sp.]|uniref:DUF389 domain-containing protein n=1 Tax=Polymorphobacter sp. TaxID=1909290 RepID=UPI003F703930
MTTARAIRPHRLVRWWRLAVIGRLDHAAVVARIDNDAGWSLRYLFMVLMSAGIAILGLLQSSPAVVIGAMLISPLMGPIIGLGFALAIFDWREVRRAITALAMGSLVAVAITALIVLASPLQSVTSEILARTRPSLFDLLVAIFSALAGTYATIRGRGETVVGVAIATALMPPLAVVGYGLATFNLAIFGGALALFLTNFIAIALSAALMARLYGFAEGLSPRQSQRQTLMISGVFILLSIPLALSLRQIASEAIATRALRSAVIEEFGSGTRISQLETDYAGTPQSASVVVVTRSFRAGADKRVQAAWQARMGENAIVNLSQLVADQDLPRIEQERNALAEARRREAGESAVAAGLVDALLLITGAPEENIVVDRVQRRVEVRALPGTSLPTLALGEARLATRHPDWQIRIIPPITSELRIDFDPGSAALSAGGRLALDTTRWALDRWNIRTVRVIGRIASSGDGPATLAAARAEAVRAALAAGERPLIATAETDLPGPLQRASERERGPALYRSVVIMPVN